MLLFITENTGLSDNMYPVDSDGGLSRKYVHAHDSRCCVVLMTAAMPSCTLESMPERRESAMETGYKEVEDMLLLVCGLWFVVCGLLFHHAAMALNGFALSKCGLLKHVHVHEAVLVLFLRVNGADE